MARWEQKQKDSSVFQYSRWEVMVVWTRGAVREEGSVWFGDVSCGPAR